jgi:hypothetical protein
VPIELIAAAVVSKFLVPALKNEAEGLLQSISAKVGQEAAEHTEGVLGKLWQRVSNAFGSEGEKTTLESFKQDPDVYEEAVTRLLSRKLEQDPALADELQRLVDEKVPGTDMTGAQVVNAGVVGIADLRSANLSGAHDLSITGANVTMGGNRLPHPSSPPDGE